MKIVSSKILIIGTGPVGLFTVFQAGMLGLDCSLVDSLENIGGQCIYLYPDKPIYDIPAYPEIKAAELIRKLEEQIMPFKPGYHMNQQVTSVQKDMTNNKWITKTSAGTTFHTDAIVIAAGCGSFSPRRPEIDNVEEFEAGGTVHYMVHDKHKFSGKKIIIAGGGDSAADWAIELSSIAKEVWMVHRRKSFRCSPESSRKIMELADNGKIKLMIPYKVNHIDGHDGKINKILLENLTDQSVTPVEADHLLYFFGLSNELGPIETWGLQMNKKHIEVDQSNCKTNTEGIYAIGDVATYSGKVKLIAAGFSEALSACHDIHKYIYPDKKIRTEYSTNTGVPTIETVKEDIMA